jgi:hypothetical protein
MNDFVLPKEWNIQITYENRELINNWKLKQEYNDDLFKSRQYNFVGQDGSGSACSKKNLITIEQFKKYVLNIEDIETLVEQEDLDYLKNFLTKLNIK